VHETVPPRPRWTKRREYCTNGFGICRRQADAWGFLMMQRLAKPAAPAVNE